MLSSRPQGGPEAEFTPPVIYSLDQRAKLVFRVEAKPDAGHAPLLRPGLPVNVTLADREDNLVTFRMIDSQAELTESEATGAPPAAPTGAGQ